MSAIDTTIAPPTIGSDAEALEIAHAYAESISPGAIDRDRDRTLPVRELEQFDRSGLLALGIPIEYGGTGARRGTIAEVIRIISVADPSIGQIPQNHFQLVDAIVRFGDDQQRQLFLGEVVGGARFGNAWSERGTKTVLDITTTLRATPDGYRLDGRKYYSTGALTARWIPVVAKDDDGEIVFVYVPRHAYGVEVLHDWTAFGQRATISGTTVLDAVNVHPQWIVRRVVTPDRASTFNAFAQVIHAAVDVGIARAALEDAVDFLRTRSRPWFEAAVERAADEPHVVLRFGQLLTRLHAAEALLRRAGELLDAADAEPTEEAVTAARLGVAEAKAFGGEIALEIASDALELLGSSATDQQYALDRHWRNARTHTLHDANRFKYVHVGRHLLDGVAPPADNWII
jgi:SfnB family sulfur acquisition oxidoreductase